MKRFQTRSTSLSCSYACEIIQANPKQSTSLNNLWKASVCSRGNTFWRSLDLLWREYVFEHVCSPRHHMLMDADLLVVRLSALMIRRPMHFSSIFPCWKCQSCIHGLFFICFRPEAFFRTTLQRCLPYNIDMQGAHDHSSFCSWHGLAF